MQIKFLSKSLWYLNELNSWTPVRKQAVYEGGGG